jgi:tRNA A37 threonylcarbamoyladenosine dehydratase
MNQVTVRFGGSQWSELCALIFSRYPHWEWATWARFGWRLAGDTLVFTHAFLDPPRSGELDESVPHVAIQEPYSLRVALESENHSLALGVIHSHPQGCLPIASHIDDDMDSYYADFLEGFTKGRPYLSLIISEVEGERVASGRVWYRNTWHAIDRFVCEGFRVPTYVRKQPKCDRPLLEERVRRLTSAFGRAAAQRVRNACIAVVGASGTGSPAIEVLARAGVGELIVVDPDHLEPSNLERVHGAYPHHAHSKTPKVAIAREHIRAIDPSIRVEAYIGRAPQQIVVDALTRADVVIGCTDQQHSRLALSEIAFRYLVPVIDCGVALEGAGGRVTGQTIQLVRFATEAPCALCREMVNWQQIGQELMDDSERLRRRAAAEYARAAGDRANGYWRETPQLNTVGYLTTAAGALAAGAALGIVSGAFDPGFTRCQLNPLNWPLDIIDWPQERRSDCCCGRLLGYADLDTAARLITSPSHWSEAVLLAE